MRVLVLNWQDRQNPLAGGAELHLHQVFGRIADRGHAVDLLCSGWRGARQREILDGIDVHRVGSRHTYPFLVRSYFRRHMAARKHDVVIEDLNKAPLYTPLWGLPKVVALVHHLFGETAFREVAAPLAAALWVAERPIGRLYRRLPFQAVSESTAHDLVARGIPRERIRVIYNGVDSETITPDPPARSPHPLFVYLGRLKKYKGVDLVIRAFAEVSHRDARLELAGTGNFRRELERLVASLGIEARVQFLGFISEEDKLRLLRRAWATVLASPKEGWGISNLESAAAGTPVIASDSPGIRESLLHEKTGLLVPHGDVGALAAAMQRLANSRELVEQLGREGRRFAERFTWERSADATLSHLGEVVQQGAS